GRRRVRLWCRQPGAQLGCAAAVGRAADRHRGDRGRGRGREDPAGPGSDDRRRAHRHGAGARGDVSARERAGQPGGAAPHRGAGGRRMRRRWTLGLGAAFLLVTGIVVAGWTAGLDAGVDGFVAAHRFARLTHFAQSVSSLGNTSVVLVILAIAGCYAAATGHRARIPALLVAPLLGFLTSSLVKVL